MKKIFIFLSFLMINSSLNAMQYTLQKSKLFTKRHYHKHIPNYEKKAPDFQFDPNQVLTTTDVDIENTIKPIFCNHKHVVAYPKECESESYGDIKVAVLEYNEIDLNYIERKNKNVCFTTTTKERIHGRWNGRYNTYGSDHATQVCNVIADMAPGIQLDFFALSNVESNFVVKDIGEEMLSVIKYNPHFINISLCLNDGRTWAHPFLERQPIPKETIDAFLEAKKKGIGIIIAGGNEKMDILKLYPNMPELLKKMSGHLLISCGTAYNWMRGTSHKKLKLVETPSSNYFYDPQWMKYGISAPAEGIACSLYPLYSMSGTSFSAPIITAAAAILKSRFPAFNAVEVFDILKKSSREYPLFVDGSRKFPHIPGVLHVTAALKLAKEKVAKENLN